MKKMAWVILIAMVAFSCTSSRRQISPSSPNLFLDEAQGEKEEYDIVVFDPQFETWFMLNWNPARDRTNEFYRAWNNRYVQAWNYKAISGTRGSQFFQPINYESHIDYGMLVNRKLYYYFQFVERELRVPILEISRTREIY